MTTENVTDAAQAAPEGVTAPKTQSTTADAKVVDYTADAEDTNAKENPAEESAESSDDEGKERDPWPRTAQDAVRRRNKRIAKRDAEIAELRKQMQERDAEIARYKPKEAVVDPNDPEPDIAKYQDWAKYNRDLTQWNLRQLQKPDKANSQPQSGQQFSPQEQAWMQQRMTQIGQRRDQVLKESPEYADVIKHAGEAIDDLPEAIQLEILKCQDPVLAVIGTMQEGILDDLADMSPALAAKYLNAAAARLQSKSASPSGQAEQTQAPAPISRPKVQSKSQKSPLEMSDDEFRKKYLRR